MSSYNDVVNELRLYNNRIKFDNETFDNKVKFCDCMDELKRHNIAGRTRPAQIVCKNIYGRLWNYLLRFFI